MIARVAVLLLGWIAAQPAPPVSCAPAAACVPLIEQAIADREYERAHDLAWRAMQQSAPNDAAMMLHLARTQSLSGRVHDALVMLRRLAQAGVRPADVETDDTFRDVRTLREWPEVVALLRASAATAPPPSNGDADAAGLVVPAAVSEPVALAYDEVSRRFVLADRSSDTLKVLDELAGNVVNLVSPGWSNGHATTAIAIDRRRGDLWVAGVLDTAGGPVSRVHHLQLISGRMLRAIDFPPEAGAVRVVDLAISGGRVWLLDAAGGRVYSLASGQAVPRVAHRLTGLDGARALAVDRAGTLYIAHASGIGRVGAQPLATAPGVDSGGLDALAWHAGHLIGVRRQAGGGYAVVRLRLDARAARITASEDLAAVDAPVLTWHHGRLAAIARDGDGRARVRTLALP